MTPEQAAALPEFHELRALIDLHHAGWRFRPTIEDGHVVEVHGARVNNRLMAQYWAGRSSRAIVEALQPRTPVHPMVWHLAPADVTQPPTAVTPAGSSGGRQAP